MSQILFPVVSVDTQRLLSIEKYKLPEVFVKPKQAAKQARKYYTPIYEWHTLQGMEHYDVLLLKEEDQMAYLQMLGQFEHPKEASLEWMAQVAIALEVGALAWSNIQVEEGRTLKEWAQQLRKTIEGYSAKASKKASKGTFSQDATGFLRKNFGYISDSWNERYKNLGGLNVLIETNGHCNRGLFVAPEALGFHFLDSANEELLVNRVRDGLVEIVSVKMGFNLELVLKNLSDELLSFKMPAGQVFENKAIEFKHQNLIIGKSYSSILEPNETRKIELEGYCINPPYGPPKGKYGNLTVFRYGKMEFSSARQVERCVREATRAYSSNWQLFKNALSLNSAYHTRHHTKAKLGIAAGLLVGLVFCLM